MLYEVVAKGAVVTIDATTGRRAPSRKLDTMLAPGVVATIDFTRRGPPAPHRLDGANLRANVDDGKVTKDGSLKFAEADPAKGKAPKIIAGAYANSIKGAKESCP